MEVGIVGNLDCAGTLSNRADVIAVGYVGSVSHAVIPVGVCGSGSQSESSVISLAEVHLKIRPSLAGGIRLAHRGQFRWMAMWTLSII